MREAPVTMLEAEGLRYLEHDARLACRPKPHRGERPDEFYKRIALDYGVKASDVAEIFGQA